VVVRADASQYEGWFYEGAGIYRHVWLNRFNNLSLYPEGCLITTRVNEGKAIVNMEATIANKNFENSKCTVYSYLTDREGHKLAQSKEEALEILPGAYWGFHANLTISSPRLWSLDDPYLYRAVFVVKQNGKIVDTLKQRIGIRTIRIDVTGVYLNDTRVKLKGVCCHQDHAGLGSALPDYIQYYRIRLLKNMGTNAYRTSHNPPTPELLDACDSLGMLVLDENRLLNSSPEYLGQFERLIRRDRNHPSVFMWSIANEEGWVQGNSTGKRIAQTLIEKLKTLDPTRTCTYAADNGNYYRGVNEVIPIRGFNYRHLQVGDYHREHPMQPLMGTEMGSTVTTRGVYEKDTVHCYVPDQDITFPWW
ncbi:MAG TPA: glycoside hydrolase family 2 TIM barrel-domain containing protein, partial [Allocoleopsis sp.]